MKEWSQTNNNNKVIVKGRGFFLVDNKGNKYLDGIANMWCNVWGHGQNPVVEAMIKQLRQIQHSTLFGLANAPSTILAEKLVKLAPGMERVFYSDNGSTAIEVAMKMAVQYWKHKGRPEKKMFISLERGYHGDTIGAMSAGFIQQYFGAYKPLLFKTHRAPSPLLYNSKYQSENELVDFCLDKTENILRKHASRCCAFIMESGAQIAGGLIIYPRGYQKKIMELCRKYNVLLILDEIATGFGRLGNIIEYKAQKSAPDIACFGKALTAGYFPLAVTLATGEIYDAFLGEVSQNKQLYHGHTFTGHPVGCSAAIANIELYEKRNLMHLIGENSRYISFRLREFSESPIVGDIRHKGMLAGVELAKNRKPINYVRKDLRIGRFVMDESLRRGVFLRSLGNILMIIPPLAIDNRNLKKIMDVQLEILGLIEKKISGNVRL